VFERDAERGEFDLESGGGTSVRGGVDGAVVGEHALGQAVGGGCVEEDAHDVGGGGHGDGNGGEYGSAVVVDEVDDLAVDAAVEVPVRHVGLPALVGERGFEALPARAWTFLGLGCDEASPYEDAVDRRSGWGLQTVGAQVVGDGRGTSIEAELPEVFA
jgi:hypothetical protein